MSLFGLSSVSQTDAQEGPTAITECREIDEPGEYVLDSDLSAEGGCLRITADDVTLDGNGYTIDGDGTGTGLSMESSGSTVRNLTVQNFGTGIEVELSNDVTLSSITVRDNDTGVLTRNSRDILCEDSTIRQNGWGVSLSDYSGVVTMRNCDLVENESYPIRAGSSAVIAVEDCRVVDNGDPVLFTPMPGSKIEGTLVSGSDGAGMETKYGDSGIFDDPTPIRNCVIEDCDGAGIDQPNGSLDVRECTLSGNRVGYRAGEPSPDPYETTLRDSNIEDNEEYGVVNPAEEYSPTVDATCNWWGAESGPVHEDNPNEDPGGQRVSGDVEFVPWSTERIEDGEGVCDGGLDEEPEEPEGPPEGGTGYISRKSYMRIKEIGPYEDVDCWGGTVYVTDPSDVEDAGFAGPGAITVPASSEEGEDAEERELPGHVIRAESDAAVTLPTWGGERGECESLLFVDPDQDLRADVEYRIVTDDPDAAYEEVDTGGFARTIHEIVQVEYEPVRSDPEENVITEPTTITEPGEYHVRSDIRSDDTCIEITRTGDVTIHGHGYSLLGSGNGTGIHNEGGFEARNLTVHGFETGIYNEIGRGVRLEGVTVEENVGNAVVGDRYVRFTLTDCTIRGNGGIGVITDEYSDLTLTDCELRGNGGNGVSGAPYTTVRVRNCLVVDNDTGVYINHYRSDLETEVIDSVVRDNAGSGVRVGATEGSVGEPVPIRNCEIRDNDGAGIVQAASFLDIRNCTLVGNQDGYRLRDSQIYEAILRNNNIEENEEYGAVVEESFSENDTIDATCNYWGHESGPDHPDNPEDDPQGQPVSDYVEFTPWSTERIDDGSGDCAGGT
ncbi:right-handed parallel beta-helix repeat-containing protein [Halorubrum halophilum]|uniref:right-handed parallel beta-helix repeat-containing protein n=1 Tax=Halorubrum halophilum TaxID=413816 RepID=UPI0006793EAC|nr:right-handed parallel beta-helix repeat-containing protein [Halorubrum halophilum]